MAYEDRYACPACGWSGAVPGGWRRYSEAGCLVRAGIVSALVLGPAIGHARLPEAASYALLAFGALVALDALRLLLARRRVVEEAREAGATEVCPRCGARGLTHERAVLPD